MLSLFRLKQYNEPYISKVNPYSRRYPPEERRGLHVFCRSAF